MKLYFGNAVTTVTTVFILILLGFIGFSVCNRNDIQYCLAAARDGLDKTIQAAIDKSCAPGLFPLISIPTLTGCIGAAAILIAAVATPIAKSQNMRQIWFYVMSGGVLLKVIVMEVSRILIRFS